MNKQDANMPLNGSDRINLVSKGLKTCQGCGLELAGRVLIETLGPDSVIAIAPGCGVNFSGEGPRTPLRIPGLLTTLADPAAFAAGIKAGFEVQGRADIKVAVLAGDGSTADIGLSSLSGALERGDRVVYVCYDNEAYASCGFQTGGAIQRKNLMRIVAAHSPPYAASASIGDIEDFKGKIIRAVETGQHGPAFIQVHTPCPLEWGYDASKTIEMARKAIRSRCWPLYEVFAGERIVLSPVVAPLPVAEYLRPQKRFATLTGAELDLAQQAVDRLYRFLADQANDKVGRTEDWDAEDMPLTTRQTA